MQALTTMANTYQDINLLNSECRQNLAKMVHDELEQALTVENDPETVIRTFFGSIEVKEKQ